MVFVQAIGEVGFTILMLVAMRVLAGRGPEPDLGDFGPLEAHEPEAHMSVTEMNWRVEERERYEEGQ